MGDFNYPEIDWNQLLSIKKDDHKASIFLETVQDCYLFQHTKHPTHHRADQDPTLIDLILTNEDEMVNEITHLPPLGKSHHSGLLFDYKCYSYISKSKNNNVSYKYYAGNYNDMRDFINECDVITNIMGKSAEEAWKVIDKILCEATDKFVPKHTIRYNFTQPPPWMNDTIRKKSRMKREAFEARRIRKDESSRKHYAKLCNQVKWEVRKAVKHYELKVAEESKRNPKAFYKYVKSKTRVKTGVPELNYNGEMATSDGDKAEVLNQFYASVFTQEDDTVPTPNHVFSGSILSDLVITEEMVKRKLDNLNQNKSPGNDRHHPRVLIQVKELLLKSLTLFS